MVRFSIQYIFSLVDRFTPNADKMGAAGRKIASAVDVAGRAMTGLGAAGSRVQGVFASIAAGATTAANAVARYAKSLFSASNVKPPTMGFVGAPGGGRGMERGFGALAMGSALSYFTGGGKQIFDTNLKFQTEFNNARAVMARSSAEDFAAMEKAVISLSKNSVFSATQIMEAVGELGSAGYEAREAMAVLPQVLQMAQAGREPLNKTAEMLIAIKNQFGIGDDKMQHVNDVLSETARQTMAKLPDLREAFKMAGPFAQIANVDLETTSALLGALAQKGIKGSLAGTGLRRMETGFLKADKRSLGFLKAYGIDPRTVYDSNGKMKDLIGTIEKLEKRGAKAKDVMKAFGDRGGPILAALIETGSVALRKLVEDLRNSDGAAEKMASEQMKGLPGAFHRMKAAVEAARLSIGKSGFEGDMISVLDKVRGFANWFTELPPQVQRFAGVAAVAAASIAGLAMPVALLGFAFATLRIGPILTLIGAIAKFGVVSLFTRRALMLLGGIGATIAIGQALGVDLDMATTALRKVGFEIGDVRKQFDDLKAAVKDLFSGSFGKLLDFLGGDDKKEHGVFGNGALGKTLDLLGLRGPSAVKSADSYYGLYPVTHGSMAAAESYNRRASAQMSPFDNFARLPEASSRARDYLPSIFRLGPEESPASWQGRSFAADAASIPQSMSIRMEPLQVNVPQSIEVNVKGTVNGPISGSGSIPLSTNAPRGTATPEAGASPN